MDAYLQFVKNLQARGYSTEEIMSQLAHQGLDLDSMQKLLKELGHESELSSAPDMVLQAYINYVKARHARGATAAEIDQDLEARGVNGRTAQAVIQMAARPSPDKALPRIPEVDIADATDSPPPEPPPVPAPQETVPAPMPKSNVTAASDHLVEVADHLSDVADKLEAIEEGKQVPASSKSLATALPPDEEAEHLNKVADHLASVSIELEAEESKQLSRTTAAKQQLNRAHQAVTSRLPMRPALKPKSLAASPAAVPTTNPKFNSKQLGSIAVMSLLYIIVFSRSLASGEKTVTWLALISMNVVGTVGFNFMLKRSEWHKIDQWLTATILQTGLFLPFFFKEIVAPIHFPHFTPFDMIVLAMATIFIISLQFCNVKALENLEASVYSVVYNSRIIFATLFGWVFLSEAVGVWGLVGGALIFTAIFIVKQKGTKSATKQGIIFGLGAAIAISATNTCEKELIKLVGYEQYIFPMFTLATITMWTIVLLRRTPAPFEILLKPRTFLLMGLRAAAGISFSYSLVFGPVAVSSYLSSLSVILMVVLGMLFLGEKDYVRSKIWATIVAVFGLTFILVDSFH